MVCQTFSGVAGMSMWRMPRGESASTRALMTAGQAPMAPASPAPFTPISLVTQGVSSSMVSSMGGMSSARGMQ